MMFLVKTQYFDKYLGRNINVGETIEADEAKKVALENAGIEIEEIEETIEADEAKKPKKGK